MAWEREGGDAKHERFVHHYREAMVAKGKQKGLSKRSGDKWTQAIKDFKSDVIKPEMRRWILDQILYSIDLGQGVSPEALHEAAAAAFEELHQVQVTDADRRELLYRERIESNPAFQRLRHAFDTWCAIWFWPGDALDVAPTPGSLHQRSSATSSLVARLRDQHRFFHWELEFPDVLTGPASGFDAIVGNPPWEIQKPNSMEFFSNVDPMYRTYGKQEAVARQTGYFESEASVEHDWISYSARLKALSNWTKQAANPFGDTTEDLFSFTRSPNENEALHRVWRDRRAGRTGYADPFHPFRHQGSADINTYKLFLEACHALLRNGGGLGLLVPSGLYTDKGTMALRELFLDRCRWTHLYAFQNERFVFAGIDHRFKMLTLAVTKGGATSQLRTRFRVGPGDSPEATELESDIPATDRYLAVPTTQLTRFSPKTRAILEIRTERDLQVLEKLYANGVLLGDDGPDGWGIRYATEFHMTNDSKLFPPRPKWEAQGYRPNEYGFWIGPDGDVALPLYQGIMINAFDPSSPSPNRSMCVRGTARRPNVLAARAFCSRRSQPLAPLTA